MTTAGARRSGHRCQEGGRSRHRRPHPCEEVLDDRQASDQLAREARTSPKSPASSLTQFAVSVSIDADRYRSADHSPEKEPRCRAGFGTLRGQVPACWPQSSHGSASSARAASSLRETSCGKQGCRCQADPPRRTGPTTSEPSSEGQDRERRLTENEPSSTDRGSTTGDASRRSSLRWRRSQPQLARYSPSGGHVRAIPRREAVTRRSGGANRQRRSAERRLKASGTRPNSDGPARSFWLSLDSVPTYLCRGFSASAFTKGSVRHLDRLQTLRIESRTMRRSTSAGCRTTINESRRSSVASAPVPGVGWTITAAFRRSSRSGQKRSWRSEGDPRHTAT